MDNNGKERSNYRINPQVWDKRGIVEKTQSPGVSNIPAGVFVKYPLGQHLLVYQQSELDKITK